MATNMEVLALHRYFGWAGYMRYQFFDRLRATAGNEQASTAAHFVEPYLPYWCAGMYTLVEGWKRLGLAHSRIDNLLDADRLKLLESFRHGVYHFHPEYYDQKFRGFWAQGREIQAWLDHLWEAFQVFFNEWIEKTLPPEERPPSPSPRPERPT